MSTSCRHPLTRLALQGAAVCALLAQAPAAHATFTTYTSQASFLAAIGGAAAASVDNFNDLAAGNLPSPSTRTAGAISYQMSGSQGFGASPGLRVLAAGGGDNWMSALNNGANMSASGFSTPVYAAGAFFFVTNDAGAVLSNISTTFSVTDINNAFGSASVINATATTFVGIVSTARLTSVGFGLSSLTHATLNDLTLSSGAAPVPEAGTAALLLGGLLALPGLLRRRHRPAR